MNRESKNYLAEADLINLLAEKYGGEEFAFIPHVPNGTAGNKSRTADALAMSLWPSRGLNLFGFEIKCQRSDWIKEKKEPQKADSVARYCDYWYLVVSDESIVQNGELPDAWGLITPRGEKLIVKKEASKLDAISMDKKFLAAILRRASKHIFGMGEFEAARQNINNEQYKKGLADGKVRAQHELDEYKERLKALENSVAEFERRSGIAMNEWNGGNIGDAVRFVMDGGIESSLRQLEHLRETAIEISNSVSRLIEGKKSQ